MKLKTIKNSFMIQTALQLSTSLRRTLHLIVLNSTVRTTKTQRQKVSLRKHFVLLSVLSVFVVPSFAQIEYAKQMAATIMKQYEDSMVVKKYASHLEQDKLPEGNRPANWNYEIGVV